MWNPSSNDCNLSCDHCCISENGHQYCGSQSECMTVLYIVIGVIVGVIILAVVCMIIRRRRMAAMRNYSPVPYIPPTNLVMTQPVPYAPMPVAYAPTTVTYPHPPGAYAPTTATYAPPPFHYDGQPQNVAYPAPQGPPQYKA